VNVAIDGGTRTDCSDNGEKSVLAADKICAQGHQQQCCRDEGHCQRVLGLVEVDVDEVVLDNEADQEVEVELDQNKVELFEVVRTV
jgi:hypothetical protein